jgi:hypothetical protein
MVRVDVEPGRRDGEDFGARATKARPFLGCLADSSSRLRSKNEQIKLSVWKNPIIDWLIRNPGKP